MKYYCPFITSIILTLSKAYMDSKILSEIDKEVVNLCIDRLITVRKQIGKEGMRFICSQTLSHAKMLMLCKILIKRR
jgi:hypothetical protein